MIDNHITDLLTDYVDETLSTPQREKVRSHLIFCLGCRRHLDEIQHNIRLLKAVPTVEIPSGLEKKILNQWLSPASVQEKQKPEKIKRAEPSHGSFHFPFYKTLGWAVAGVLAVMVIRNIPDDTLTFSTRQQAVPVQSRHKEIAREPQTDALTNLPATPLLDQKKEGHQGWAMNLQSKTLGVPPALGEKSVQPQAIALNSASVAVAPRSEKQLLLKGTQSDKIGIEKQEEKMKAQPVADSAAAEPPFQELSGQNSGVIEPLETVISKQDAWEKIWKNHAEFQTPPATSPRVDFKNNQVIALFAGVKNSGGFAFQIAKVEETSWEGKPARIVYFKLKEPAAGSFNTMALTHPFIFKVVPRINGPTFFKKIR